MSKRFHVTAHAITRYRDATETTRSDLKIVNKIHKILKGSRRVITKYGLEKFLHNGCREAEYYRNALWTIIVIEKRIITIYLDGKHNRYKDISDEIDCRESSWSF